MWWQWLLVFLFLVITAFGYLVAFVLGAKSSRGEEICLRPKPPPKPIYNDPVANNARRAEERRLARQPIPDSRVQGIP